jgi:hypothetical protein
MRFCGLVGTSLLLLISVGCGRSGYAELGLVELSGVVTLDGAPLEGAKVSFESDDKRRAIGVTDASGRYALMYDSEMPGVTPGSKTVRITTADLGVEGDGFAEGASPAKERVPARYNTDSTLKADVSTSKNTFNFDLKSAP